LTTATEMNTTAIEKALKKRCGRKFLGVYAIDRLPPDLPQRRPLMMICNTDPHDKKGEHWVAIYFGVNGGGEYFDSFGRLPEHIISSYLNKNCSVWTYNERQLQSVVSYFCGQYCIFYCLYRSVGYDLDNILKCFGKDTGLNDWFVHDFICRMLNIA
jgi:hypothetical protein